MKKAIILLGPTGVGKTAVSVLLAKELRTEIISADSMQIYRHMDIGTAKPSAEEMAGVKHHMIDIVEPSESYSAGRYVEDVSPIIEVLVQQNRIPLIVGGTGLYIRAMTRGLFSGPSSDQTLREGLIAIEAENPGALYQRLCEVDPEAAARTEKQNIRRILRAIEVAELSGRTITSMQKEMTRPLPYDFVKIGLTRSREELYRRIDIRVEDMLRAGLVDEVKRVISMDPCMTPLQAIGCKEVLQHLNGGIEMREAVRLIKRNSRRYAKRQYTWFSREEGIHWIDITGSADSTEVLQRVLQELEKCGIRPESGTGETA